MPVEKLFAFDERREIWWDKSMDLSSFSDFPNRVGPLGHFVICKESAKSLKATDNRKLLHCTG